MNKSNYPKAKDGAKTAIELQKEKRDALYAKERARRAKNEESNRRARMTPTERAKLEKSERNKPDNAVGVGVGPIGKYMKTDPLKLRKEQAKPAPKKSPVKRVASEAVPADRRNAISMMKATKATPTKGVTPIKGVDATSRNRVFTDKEKKIMSVLEKGKKKNGTMKASAQRKIQRIRKSK
jgi:hypothetical protein